MSAGRGVPRAEALKYFHGGFAGLSKGDEIVPSPPHQEDGCLICVARAEGRRVTVGEWRRWLHTLPPSRGRNELLQLSADWPAWEVVDPPTGEPDRVYITTDRGYAAWYAARSGNGDLYQVEPIGEIVPTSEDPFPSFTAPRARVILVLRRRVRLTRKERRRLMRRWEKADAKAARRPDRLAQAASVRAYKGAGNAIVPQVAAEFVRAYLDVGAAR